MNVSSVRDVGSGTAISERGEQVGISNSYGRVFDRNSIFHE